ncbi:PREDICTED: chymotrypsin-elastase inhibitor ixodidin-like [Wasmannia auropunctata]|uniref:chymotrypsin-elastase inhibitor ixodidin-like n=1 Tax=Wasmannia auropunctata TaxID=64793 RepID=UPI0005ED7D96|nr:PREDICTED: chymotrypsin-elastase inhibitor ixodidin-like [Wasmannia auropunctata]
MGFVVFFVIAVLGLHCFNNLDSVSAEATKTTPCGQNEIYMNCAVETFCSEYERIFGNSRATRDSRRCIEGCVCKRGYARLNHKMCILESECRFYY